MKKLRNKYLPRAYGQYYNLLALFSKRNAAQKAFRLFCTPRKGRILPEQLGFLNAAENGSLHIKDQSFQTYRWKGNRETILLIHGWESNSFRWRNLVNSLSKEGYNIISIDAPAHGNSSGEAFNVPLYVDGINMAVKRYKPQYIISHSIGGMAAIYHQYKYPDNSAQKIITIGAPSEFSELIAQYRKLLNFNSRVEAALDNHIYKRFGFRIRDFSTAVFAREITIRGLLIHDELDQIAPIGASEKVHANWIDSLLFKTRGLGHSLHQKEVSDRIIHFLNS